MIEGLTSLLDTQAAALRRATFEESGRTRLALGLGSGSAACIRVLPRWTLCVGSTKVTLCAVRYIAFEESARTVLALGLG